MWRLGRNDCVVAPRDCRKPRSEFVGSGLAELSLLAILQSLTPTSAFTGEGNTCFEFLKFSLVLYRERFGRGVEMGEQLVNETCDCGSSSVQAVGNLGEGVKSFCETIVGGEEASTGDIARRRCGGTLR